MKKRWLRKLLCRVEVVHIEPGDVLMVSTDRIVSREEWALVQEQLRAHFPGTESVWLPVGWHVDPARKGDVT